MADSYTLASDLLQGVRDNLDESAAAFWTDARLYRCIDRAKNEIWLHVRSLKRGYFEVERTSLDGSLSILGTSYPASSFAIVAGTATYTLPPDFAEMTLIECITSGYETVRFAYLPKQHPRFRAAIALTSNQSPSVILYDIEGRNVMRIAPKSDTALDLRISYVKIQTAITTGTDVLDLPHPLYIAVEELATKRAQMQDRDPTSQWWATETQQTVMRFLGGHARQSMDIEVAEGYDP